jgi:hypothetical protein
MLSSLGTHTATKAKHSPVEANLEPMRNADVAVKEGTNATTSATTNAVDATILNEVAVALENLVTDTISMIDAVIEVAASNVARAKTRRVGNTASRASPRHNRP